VGNNIAGKSDKDWVTPLLLCFFLGEFGIHHFYVGKTGLGILYLLTGGLFGLGWLVFFIKFLIGTYEDADGRLVKN
jgi:TM2 domain-containing membrane protein YozV